jgi:hypothetical protein
VSEKSTDFGVTVVPLDTTSVSYFLNFQQPLKQYGRRTTPTVLTTKSGDDVWQQILKFSTLFWYHFPKRNTREWGLYEIYIYCI